MHVSMSVCSVSWQFGLHPWWIHRHYADHEQGPGLGPGLEGAAEVGREGVLSWERDLELALVACPSAGVGECGLDKNIVKEKDKDKSSGSRGADVGHGGVSMESQEDILRRHIRVAERLHR